MANALQPIGGSVPMGLESPTKERKVIRITEIVRKENSMDKVEKIKEKVERLIEKAKQGDGEYFNGAWHTLITLTDFIDSLEEEPVIVDVPPYDYVKGFSDGRLYEKRQKEEPVNSIWHDASEMPDKEKKILTIGYNDETYVGYFNGVNPRLIKQWAYIDVLLNLTTKEEPVSEELEKEIYNYIKDNFFGSETYGFCSNRTGGELDCVDVVNIARHFANWQKEQMMNGAIELPLYLDGDFLTIDYDFTESGFKVGDKVKLIIIKED